MEKITELFDKLDLGKLVPQMDTLMGWIQWLTMLAVRIGPVCILVLGLIYLLIPPREANRKAGYRTYFGMGSITAWRFTQRVSGLLMTLVGLVLTIIAFITAAKFPRLQPQVMVEKAMACIKSQIICALVIFVVMFLVTAIFFDRKGSYRFSIDHSTFPGNLLPPEDVSYVEVTGSRPRKTRKKTASNFSFRPAPKTNTPPPAVNADPYADPYAQQQSQPLTADDIVIEDL